MIPDKAYSLAMSAGYIPYPRKPVGGYDGKPHGAEPNWAYDALNPGFWQALGKALGWSKGLKGYSRQVPWQAKAKKFYDLILTGGDTDKFWEEICPTTTV